MLALAVRSAEDIENVQHIFSVMRDHLYLACAGAPLGNGIAAVRSSPAVVIFEVARELSPDAKTALAAAGAFNVSQRQALRGVCKSTGYFADPAQCPTQSLARATAFLDELLRLDAVRREVLGSAPPPPAALLFFAPSSLAAFEIVHRIMAARGISPRDADHPGYMVPVVVGRDATGAGRVAVACRRPPSPEVLREICGDSTPPACGVGAPEIVTERLHPAALGDGAHVVMDAWAELVMRDGEWTAAAARAATAGLPHAEALHMLDVTLTTRALRMARETA